MSDRVKNSVAIRIALAEDTSRKPDPLRFFVVCRVTTDDGNDMTHTSPGMMTLEAAKDLAMKLGDDIKESAQPFLTEDGDRMVAVSKEEPGMTLGEVMNAPIDWLSK